MRTEFHSWSLRRQVALGAWAATVRARTADRIRGAMGSARGQTPTEYLMIVGLMAAIIVVVFIAFYWEQVKTAASDWVGKVKDAILGTDITP